MYCSRRMNCEVCFSSKSYIEGYHYQSHYCYSSQVKVSGVAFHLSIVHDTHSDEQVQQEYASSLELQK